MQRIIAYAKAHPWATGIIVVVGGIIFLSITGIFGSSGGSGGTSDDGPSDAEIMANAQIQAATIQAQAAAAQAGASLRAAEMGYGYQLESEKLQSEVAFRTLEVQKELGLAGLTNERELGLATIGAQRDVTLANISGQIETQRIIANASKSKNKSNNIAGLLGGIAGGIFSIFSDSHLKDNIRYIGHNGSHGLYEFNYRGSKTKYVGVMAEEVARSTPDEVIQSKQGWLMLAPKREFIPRLNIMAAKEHGGPHIETIH
jgi:hypothetical protein